MTANKKSRPSKSRSDKSKSFFLGSTSYLFLTLSRNSPGSTITQKMKQPQKITKFYTLTLLNKSQHDDLPTRNRKNSNCTISAL